MHLPSVRTFHLSVTKVDRKVPRINVSLFKSVPPTHLRQVEQHVTTGSQLFTAAIFNTMSDVQADITYLEDEANS